MVNNCRNGTALLVIYFLKRNESYMYGVIW
jgi:hypothetical protein